MNKYNINFVEYNEMMEYDGKPYPILLDPLNLEQLKEALEMVNGFTSFIRTKAEAKFFAKFIDNDLVANDGKIDIESKEQKDVFIAIRFMGPPIKDIENLSFDNDIEIYVVQLMEEQI